MCFDLEELNLRVVMKGVEKRVGKLLGMEGICGDGRKLWGWGAMEVVW